MEKLKLVVINIVAVTALAATYVAGKLDVILDSSYVSGLIALLLLVGIVEAFRGKWARVKWIAEKLPAIGLAATVYGILLLSHGAGVSANGVDALRLAIITGVSAALGPNISGIIGYIWLSTLSFFATGEDY